jgi:hypothetical protein
MKKNVKNLCLLLILGLVSCTQTSFTRKIESGNYKEAENLVKLMKGDKKYDCAETLIREYLDIEEYDKAVYVYEKITPEHCSNSNMRWPSLYCHGASEQYEIVVTALFRKVFTEIGDYDKVWQYSVWETDDDSGYNAPAYYKFMSEVILHLLSKGNKTEAYRFLNHYVFWFDVRVDHTSYSDDYQEFHCDVVRSRLQTLIDRY